MSEPDGPPAGLVTIAFVHSQPEASVLVCTLRAYGIPAWAADQGTIYALPNLMLAMWGIRIDVPAALRDDAVALLYEIDGGWTCPPRPWARQSWLSIAMTILFGFILFVTVPPPRARGSYAWRRRQAGSGSPAR